MKFLFGMFILVLALSSIKTVKVVNEINLLDEEIVIVDKVGSVLDALEAYAAGGTIAMEKYSIDCYRDPNVSCVYFDIAAARIEYNKHSQSKYFMTDRINRIEGIDTNSIPETKEFIESIVDYHMEDATKETDEMTIEHPTITIEE